MKRPGAKIIIAALLLIALAATYFVLAGSELGRLFEDRQLLLARIRTFGVVGPLVVIAMMVLAIVLNPLPSAPVALAAGALYGHTLGTVYVVIGAELGAIAAFVIARKIGYDFIRQHVGETRLLGRFGSQNSLTLIVFASRLVPFMSFDLISYGAGLTPLELWRFALATLLGLLPMSFVLAHLGSEFAAGDNDAIASLVLWLGLLVAIPLVLGCIFRRPDRQRSNVDEISG